MKLKKIIRIVVLSPLFVYLIYCSYSFITTENCPKYIDCGVIVSKSNDEVAIKNGSRTELYLNVQFKKSGFRSIETSPTTYFSKKTGQTVCFDLKKEVSFWYKTNNTIGGLFLLLLAFCFIYLLVNYLIVD